MIPCSVVAFVRRNNYVGGRLVPISCGTPSYIFASNELDGKITLLNKIKQVYPAFDGWYDHGIIVEEIPKECIIQAFSQPWYKVYVCMFMAYQYHRYGVRYVYTGMVVTEVSNELEAEIQTYAAFEDDYPRSAGWSDFQVIMNEVDRTFVVKAARLLGYR
jgi:hypothetical protein